MQNTYYSIYKWGDLSVNAEIDELLISILEEKLNTTISMDKLKIKSNINSVSLGKEYVSRLPENVKEKIVSIVGKENVLIDDYNRVLFAQGKSYNDLLNVRSDKIKFLPDLIIAPKDEYDVIQIVEFCAKNSISIVPVGGKSTVTSGIEFPNGGIAIDCTKHLNKVIEINEINNTVKVQPGIYGPKLEIYLNNFLKDEKDIGYTCGHFPQSFEFSTVGGWVAARGAGQESTGYGKIEDMVLGLRIVTPKGILIIEDFPARSTGPDLAQIIIGSEGYFGIITEVTLKIWKNKNTRYFSFLFKDWNTGVQAMRNVMQGRFGQPFLFRLSDPDQTDLFIRLSRLPSWKDKYLEMRGYKAKKRVLLMGSVAGDTEYCKFVVRKIKKTSKKFGGLLISSNPVKHWLKERFATPYLRDNLMNENLIVDTLETTCRWDNLEFIRDIVRDTILKRPNTFCTVHISHVYENGANLYFSYISKLDDLDPISKYQKYQREIIQSIKASGGTLSHHHGIGRLFNPWMDKEIGTVGIEIIRGIKQKLDGNNIMNPGVLVG